MPIASFDAAILSMELSARAWGRSGHTVNPETGSMQADLATGLLLLGATYVSAHGPNSEAALAGFAQLRENLRELDESVDNPDTLSSSLEALRLSPTPAQAGVTAAYSKRMLTFVEDVATRALASNEFPHLDSELSYDLTAWAQALLAMRRIQFDPSDPKLPPADGHMLKGWFDTIALATAGDEGTAAQELRQAIGSMCRAYLSEEFSSEDPVSASGEADEWFDHAVDVLRAAGTPEEEYVAAVVTCLAPMRPVDEREWAVWDAVQALALSIFIVLAAGWDDDSAEGDSDEAFAQFDQTMAAWWQALMTCREQFAAEAAAATT